MIFRAKISTTDLSIWPPIQSAFLQETKIYHKFPETRTTTPLATSAETGQKLTLPFKLVASGHHLSGETEGAGFQSCCLSTHKPSSMVWTLCVVLLAALISKASGLAALQSSKEKPCCIQQNQQSSAWCQSPGQQWTGVPDWKQQAPFGRTVKQRFLQHLWQGL